MGRHFRDEQGSQMQSYQQWTFCYSNHSDFGLKSRSDIVLLQAEVLGSLQTHFQDLDLSEMLHPLATACLLAAFWEASSQDSLQQGREETASAGPKRLRPHMLFEALLRIRFNAVAIVPKEHSSARDRLAVAIFRQASMLNHACQANLELRFRGRTVTVEATCGIDGGEPLRHCYGPQVVSGV